MSDPASASPPGDAPVTAPDSPDTPGAHAHAPTHAPAHDVVIVGGGHNGLVAAAYLAQAGRSVLVLERAEELGGAAVSAQAFEGVDARLSRYSYLVSLLPQRIVDELGLRIAFARRRYGSYTPDPDDPSRGLLVDTSDARTTALSFARIGAEHDAEAWAAFYAQTTRLAQAVFPTMLEPLMTRDEMRATVDDEEMWNSVVEQPLGRVIRDRFDSDLVRGVVLTDGLIGTFASADDASLDANRCFLYHVIGNGTGEWNVPIGGMGAVSGELARVAREAGAELVTGAEVTAITPDGEVRFRQRKHRGGRRRERVVQAGTVLANVAPAVLDGLLGENGDGDLTARPAPEGAQVKVNLLLSRLPRLRDETVTPEQAFGGTFHVNETFEQLESVHAGAARGVMPERLPCEIYCHSLADPSILSPELAASGAHTLTVFGLHTPHRWLTAENNDATRERLTRAVLASLDSVLAEPIEDLILRDATGRPCIETKTTLDLENTLALPGGNIFHGPLSWPWACDEPLITAAQRWGVATRHPRILLCGSGARRGGAVSGIGGHNAAMAVLEG
ncbi:phytoene desaturase family protein [Compostimonas suwonensis]|uniref:Phytoene dehydrogenase-like protein n=1 Tax=Compostimonas suwonensis TaxID=1048394 RepID=A0A2M9C3U0_9MICO|nr:NAD(P)/FAD-dependent oxidoreductase [Compostimonas suwonensis]PJJ65195.1 phytoene dehydrogenase-like protein [Compostimonas suwonensis]